MPFPKLDIELDDAYQAFLADRRLAIRERAAEAAARAGRDASDVSMLAVSKSVEPEATLLAWRAGWRAFAENRPQELARKLEFAEGAPEMAGVRFDAIGNLQKNKINQVIGRVDLLHSVSSLELAEAVSKRCCARGIVQPALVEVNVLGEQSKSGFSPQEAREAAEALAAGRPVVTSDRGAHTSFLDPSVAEIVSQDDPLTWARAVIEVMRRCEGLTAQDIQDTLPRAFSPEEVAGTYGRAYEAAIAVHSARH